MPIENLPVWSLPPNWDNEVSEIMQWQTDILPSRTGAEQRISRRPHPRIAYEFALLLEGTDRRVFSNLMDGRFNIHSYLPLWYEVGLTTEASRDNLLPSTEGVEMGLGPGSIIFIPGANAFDYELAEVSFVGPLNIFLTSNLLKIYPAGTPFYPVTRAQVVEEPRQTKMSSTVIGSTIRFRDMTPRPVPANTAGLGFPVPDANALLPRTYLGYPLFRDAPDHSQEIEFGAERLTEEIDSGSAIPLRYDTANRSFFTQGHTWFLQGRSQHASFRRFLDYAMGRKRPMWVPSFMDDFEINWPIAAGADFFQSTPTGIARSGGLRDTRRHVMIETASARHIYELIVANHNQSTGRDVMRINGTFPVAIDPSEIIRACFINLMRLNHDEVEIIHKTDTVGLSTVKVTFRHTPETRSAASAFQ